MTESAAGNATPRPLAGVARGLRAAVAGPRLAVLAALLAGAPTFPGAAPPALADEDPSAGARWSIEDPGQGILQVRAPGPGSIELSGLAWVQGDLWLAVSDRLASLHPLRIEVGENGRVTGADVHPGVRLEGARDPEGLAYAPDSASVFVADEDGPAIREHAPSTGRLLRTIPLPSAFAGARRNLGLESLSRDPATGVAWTANEEALATDGPRATEEAGTLVRLQRFDRDWRPDGQWAWRTEALRPGEDRTTGVSDLVALPDGGLLVLERSHGAKGVRVALWEADLASAPEVQPVGGLPQSAVVPRKHLIWQAATGRFNFEGAALGPALPDGGRSLILVADDGRGGDFGLYPLLLRPRAAPATSGFVDAPHAPAPRAARKARAHRPPAPRSAHRLHSRRLRPTPGLLPR